MCPCGMAVNTNYHRIEDSFSLPVYCLSRQEGVFRFFRLNYVIKRFQSQHIVVHLNTCLVFALPVRFNSESAKPPSS